MILHFFIQYHTNYGQAIHLIIHQSKEAHAQIKIPLQFHDDEYWSVIVDTDRMGLKTSFRYAYYLTDQDGEEGKPLSIQKKLELPDEKKKETYIYEQVIQQPDLEAVYGSKAFNILVKKSKKRKYKKAGDKHPTHIFKVYAPVMDERYVVCLTGSGKHLNEWDKAAPILLNQKKKYWTVELNFSKTHSPVEYKLGLYDLELGSIIYFEGGDNRQLPENSHKDCISILIHNGAFEQYCWKAAGVNIPVSSLRSTNSWGIGDFTDLNLLTDWATSTGMKMIQLLPVNDTTATHTSKDSYPYAAISPFALHPLYLNIQRLATNYAVDLPSGMKEEIAALNALPTLNYEGVLALKTEAIQLVYAKDKQNFKDDFAWIEFFDLNRHWLVPYAVFCCLRDRNQTPAFDQWDELSVYSEEQVQEFASPGTAYYDEICIHYFIQYHLHLQLQDALAYAHKNNIIFKGDLPIGIGRYSVDTWMYPRLFHMDMQAGAPPDYYTAKGQNWSFPTYNWEAMAADEYKWWRQRMEHMGNYFDAIRIDHVLGFFRIWSIPTTALEGTLGIFQPVKPIDDSTFSYNNVPVTERLVKPYITSTLLQEYFGAEEEWVSSTFLENGGFKKAYDTQEKIGAFFSANPEKRIHEDRLLWLMSNVILIEDTQQPGFYHFRINMQQTSSFLELKEHDRQVLEYLYNQYFFHAQNELWEKEGIKKITALKATTDMLLCAEDLGMVPDFMEQVLHDMRILSLQVQRMPKVASDNFSHPKNAIYLSVVTPSTHDMSTIRQWWQDEKQHIQYFYNYILGHEGMAPGLCEPWISKEIIEQHMCSPAMWAVFLLQDLMGMDEALRSGKPEAERINDPANANHEWNYRLHINLEQLLQENDFNESIRQMLLNCGR